jgi:hypothetical protein
MDALVRRLREMSSYQRERRQDEDVATLTAQAADTITSLVAALEGLVRAVDHGFTCTCGEGYDGEARDEMRAAQVALGIASSEIITEPGRHAVIFRNNTTVLIERLREDNDSLRQMLIMSDMVKADRDRHRDKIEAERAKKDADMIAMLVQVFSDEDYRPDEREMALDYARAALREVGRRDEAVEPSLQRDSERPCRMCGAPDHCALLHSDETRRPILRRREVGRG